MAEQHSKYYRILLTCVVVWCALIIAPPLLTASDPAGSAGGEFIYSSFSKICHQYNSRSFHIMGYKFAVCSRCTAIYFGFLAGLLLWRWGRVSIVRNSRKWWCIALAPMLTDVLADVSALHTSSLMTKSISGGIFGVIAAILLVPVFIQSCPEFFRHLRQPITVMK